MINLRESSKDVIKKELEKLKYFANDELAWALRNATILNKPILVEGPPGVGKTELAKTIATMLGTEMIRLQCTPGMNEKKAIYDFNYSKQLLYIQMLKEDLNFANGASIEEKIEALDQNNPFYSEAFLVKRPVLQAFLPTDNKQKVLLIDELDKAEADFEYSLLEPFSDYTVSIPEMGKIEAKVKPLTIITSNRSKRKLEDTMLRRCVYVYLEYPPVEEEAKIIEIRTNANQKLARQLAELVGRLRQLKLAHKPSIAESVEWAEVLQLHCDGEASEELLKQTISIISKTPQDRQKMLEHI